MTSPAVADRDDAWARLRPHLLEAGADALVLSRWSSLPDLTLACPRPAVASLSALVDDLPWVWRRDATGRYGEPLRVWHLDGGAVVRVRQPALRPDPMSRLLRLALRHRPHGVGPVDPPPAVQVLATRIEAGASLAGLPDLVAELDASATPAEVRVVADRARVRGAARLGRRASWTDRLLARLARATSKEGTTRARFAGLELLVPPGVFLPRRVSEEMVRVCLARLAGAAPGTGVIELGTGSGAVGLALASARPDLDVLATDLAPGAVDAARANAQRLGLPLEVVVADLFAGVPGRMRGRTRLVVGNVPCLVAEEFEGAADTDALGYVGTDDGLGLHRALLDESTAWLSPDGVVVLQLPPDRVQDLLPEAAARGWAVAQRVDGPVAAFLALRRPGQPVGTQ